VMMSVMALLAILGSRLRKRAAPSSIAFSRSDPASRDLSPVTALAPPMDAGAMSAGSRQAIGGLLGLQLHRPA
jgi:hypothetical protein